MEYFVFENIRYKIPDKIGWPVTGVIVDDHRYFLENSPEGK